MSDLWKRFDQRWQMEPLPGAGQPIFVLAAGWRSSSTLLQRLIVSSKEALIWGEPYGRSGLIPGMTRTALSLRENWPTSSHVLPGQLPENLSDLWIANLYPSPVALRAGWRAQLDALLDMPASVRGFSRFGLKEVRLHAIDAHFLKWIYPDARFLFLVRNPWDAWASARGGTWFYRWPNERIVDATGFARHWRRLVESFIGFSDESGMMIRYEDLTGPDFDLEPIRIHTSLSRIDPAVLTRRVRGMKRPPEPLTPMEVAEIARICDPLTGKLGYQGPTRMRAAG